MEKSTKQNIIIILLIANLALIYFMGNSIKNDMNMRISSLNNSISSVQNSVGYLSTDINNQVQNALGAELILVDYIEKEITAVDIDKKNMTTHFTISPKSTQDVVEFTLIAKNEEKDETIQIPFTQDGALEFSCDINTSYLDRYEVYVQKENTDGSFSKASHGNNINFAPFMYNRVSERGMEHSARNGVHDYTTNFSVNTWGFDQLDIEKVELVLVPYHNISKDEAIVVADITDDVKEGTTDIKNSYENEFAVEEEAKYAIESSNAFQAEIIHYTYSDKIDEAEYPIYSEYEQQDYMLCLKVTCKDGYTYILI